MGENKLFNDPIHGTILLAPFLVKIMDTPEFQRLRHIKQLGGTYYVYPGAQHNRFEHSIGTAHLAGKLVEHLQREQPELEITEKDVLCVKVAGLCHDLGHGPFSHLFDRNFLPRQDVKKWAHERGSCDMFERVIKDIDPHSVTLTEQDRLFVKEMINGKEMGEDWAHRGRDENKSFLYEIISNKTNGVDVDKWDYVARDCHHLGISNGFDHNRLIECTKVLKVEDDNQAKRRRICYRDKEVYNLYELFHTRFSLHKGAYQHKAANAVELMICDTLVEADPTITIRHGNGQTSRMSGCVKRKNLDAYCKLDDRILQKIEHSQDDDLEPARKILKRLYWQQDFQKASKKGRHNEAENEIRIDIEDRLFPNFEHQIKASILIFNYGKGDKNPIDYSRFYTKRDQTKAIPIPREEVSILLPSVFQERWVQVFCTKQCLSEAEIATVKSGFDE